MADELKKAFLNWFKETYPNIPIKWIGDWKKSPQYDYWLKNVHNALPTGEPTIANYALQAAVVLDAMQASGDIDAEKYKIIEDELTRRLPIEGIHAGLPLYNEVSYRLRVSEWGRYQKEVAAQKAQQEQVDIERPMQQFMANAWQQEGAKRQADLAQNMANQRQWIAQQQEAQQQANIEAQKQSLDEVQNALLQDVATNPRSWIQAHIAQGLILERQTDLARLGTEKPVTAISPEEAYGRGGTQWVTPEMTQKALNTLWGRYVSDPSTYPQPTPEMATSVAASEGGMATGRGENAWLSYRPSLPYVPEWLMKYVPSLRNVPISGAEASPWGFGRQLRKGEVVTPSPQQWAQTPVSEQAGLAGYMDWAGSSYEDMMKRMGQMIPQRPSLGSRWAAARQYA